MSKYPDPIITKTAIIFNLHEPIYGSHFGIWDKWLKIAKTKSLNMIVKTPFGKITYIYSTYMKGAVLKKRYFKNPKVPMRFWCRDMLPDIKARDERKKLEEKQQQGITQSGAGTLVSAWKDMLRAKKLKIA